MYHTSRSRVELSSLHSASFFFTDAPPPAIYTLSLHDALPISLRRRAPRDRAGSDGARPRRQARGRRADRGLAVGGERSEEHTSELQLRLHLVCRLLLEKKKSKLREKPCGKLGDVESSGSSWTL